MDFNEWIENKPSLFREINTTGEFEFITEYGAEELDMLYKMLYGRKQVPLSIIPLSIPELASIIRVNYGDIWNEKYKYMKSMQVGVGRETTTSETVLDETTNTNTSSNTTKTSAFNVDEMTPNDGNDDSFDGTTSRDSMTDRTKTENDFRTAQEQLSMLENNFAKTVCVDISQLLSLSIY